MALLSNPMGALAYINTAGGITSTSVSPQPSYLDRLISSSTGDDDEGGREAPSTLADWRCMTQHPVTQETWTECQSWCQVNKPDKPCAVSCFYGSDGRGGCVLKTNCTECSEAPGETPSELAPNP